MTKDKSRLIKISRKVQNNQPLKADEALLITEFEKVSKENKLFSFLKRLIFPLAIALGVSIAYYSSNFERFTNNLPSWTNLSPSGLSAFDYLWSIVGNPVSKANIIYHLPNIILYSFGVIGAKKLLDAIDRRTWLDLVYKSKEIVNDKINSGSLNFSLKKGHSILFVGNGDFIGAQFVLNNSLENVVTVAENKLRHTIVWNHYLSNGGYSDLENVLIRCDAKDAGEYIFFPVKDDQVFLPSPTSYDLSPHRLDILCQDIRTIERLNHWKQKRIIVVGDRFHQSVVYSEDRKNRLRETKDVISITSISNKYSNVTVIDPTDVVLKEVINIANGRKIVFRATQDGLREYKKRFFERLDELGYKPNRSKKGVLTIGYDIFEDQIEQQTLSRKIDDYYPIVLSKTVRDALIRNGYKKEEFIYVPDIVLSVLFKKASEQ